MTIIPTPASMETYGRHDMYKNIHKALRKAQCDMLVALGNADFDSQEASALLARLRDLLAFGATHIKHEEAHIHPRLEQIESGSTARLDHQHTEHRDSFAYLESLIGQIETAPWNRRAEAGHRLYLAYARFIADDFVHMHEEETVNNQHLWRACADSELRMIEAGIIASIPQDQIVPSLSRMIPALNREERAHLLGGIKANAPREAFAAIMNLAARPGLSEADYNDLSQRLAEPALQ